YISPALGRWATITTRDRNRAKLCKRRAGFLVSMSPRRDAAPCRMQGRLHGPRRAGPTQRTAARWQTILTAEPIEAVQATIMAGPASGWRWSLSWLLRDLQ